MYRQGKFLLLPLEDGEPSFGPRVQRGKVITFVFDSSHPYRIEASGGLALYQNAGSVTGSSGAQYLLEVKKPAEWLTERHQTINVEPGLYVVIRQREYRWGEW